MTDKSTISPAYLEQQIALHKNPNYGIASLAFAPLVAQIIKSNGFRSVSDYGAGKKRLLDGLAQAGVLLDTYHPYDPAFPDYGPAIQAPFVCCIDVLEHVEEDRLEFVLKDLFRITVGIGFFSIHTGPAAKYLPDGRNAHLIQQSSSWWLPRLCEHFEVLHLQTHKMMGSGFWVIVSRNNLKNP